LYGHKHTTILVNRHFLHASRLTILLPEEVKLTTFEAPLPIELKDVLKRLSEEQ
jgi:23S rRNA pseudouridine1911/1915/1917 synthase